MKFLFVAAAAAGQVVAAASSSQAKINSIVAEVVDYFHTKSDFHPQRLGNAGAPSIAQQYAGSVHDSSDTSSLITEASYEVYDEQQKFNVVQSSLALPFQSGKYVINTTEILHSPSSYLVISDRCQPLPSEDVFASKWAWLQYATSAGNTTVQGRPCSLWTLDVPAKSISLAVCVDAKTNRLPLLYNVSTVGYSASSTYGPDIHENLAPSDLARLVIPKPCFESPTVCPGGEVQEFDAYIFHPANVFDIYNEDVADLIGDTAFICADNLANHTSADAYQWVSRYSLQVWTGWGDYAECNRPSPSEEGVCISKEKYLVGREASFGLKPHAGQCVDNSDVGVWLSLPEAGMCQNESQVIGPEGTGDCSWRIVQKLKTINGTCLLKQQGMLESCSKETDFPFAKTTAILASAFNSSDPSQGGCPDISPTATVA